MSEIFGGLALADWIVYLALLGGALGVMGFFARVVNSRGNDLEWWHFVATRSRDGDKYYADLDKLGKVTGIVIGSLVVLWYGWALKLDIGIFGTYLAFVGGIAGYSAYLRSKGPPPSTKE